MDSPAATTLTAPHMAAAPSDFHRLFPQVPVNENVVQEFQCSLSRKKILRVGRLYVTPVRLCFSSMLVDAVELPWADVSNCEKKSQMLFDQIIITPTDRTRYGGELCFTGFMNGCASPFSTIKMLWGVRKKYAKIAAPSNGSMGSMDSAASPTSQAQARVTEQAFLDNLAAADRGVTSPDGLGPIDAKTPEAGPLNSTPAGYSSPHRPKDESPAPRGDVGPLIDPGAQSPAQNASFAGLSNPLSVSQSEPPPDPEVERRNLGSRESIHGVDVPPISIGKASPTHAAGTPRAGTPSSTVHGGKESEVDASQSFGNTTRSLLPSSPPHLHTTCIVTSSTATGMPPLAITSAGRGHGRTRSDPGQGQDVSTPRPDPALLQAASVSQSDFLKNFPNVPRTESILDSFQCSYVSGVHRLGKMHITGNYLLFHSVMLSEPIVAKLVDIASIEKSTSLLVLDGVSIVLKDGTRHDFTSFISREKAYHMIAQLVNTHQNISRSLGSNVSAGARPEMASRSESPARPANGSMTAASTADLRDSDSLNMSDRNGKDKKDKKDKKKEKKDKKDKDKGKDATKSDPLNNTRTNSQQGVDASDDEDAKTVSLGNTSKAESPRSVGTSSGSFVTSTAAPNAPLIVSAELNDLDAICPTDYGTAFSKPSLFLDTPLTADCHYPPGYTVQDVFRWVFDDTAPVLKQYRDFRRDADVKLEPWRPPTAASTTNGNPTPQTGQRIMHCDTIIRALITERYYPFEEFHRFAFMQIQGKPTLVIQTSGQASGVTFSDTFRTESLCVYTQGTDDASGLPRVTARHYCYVQFLKFSIVKGKIRSESTRELKEGMSKMNELTINYLRDAPSSASLEKSVAEGAKGGGKPSAASRSMEGTSGQPGAAGTSATTHSPLSRGPSSATLLHAAGPSASVATVTTAAGAAPALPKFAPLRIASLVMLLLAFLYFLRAAWNVFWFYAEDVPLVPMVQTVGPGSPAGRNDDITAIQSAAALQTLANFVAFVVRPIVGCVLWVSLARAVPWVESLIEAQASA
jgi:hypothetical protein